MTHSDKTEKGQTESVTFTLAPLAFLQLSGLYLLVQPLAAR